jgi:hypothetical protein
VGVIGYQGGSITLLPQGETAVHHFFSDSAAPHPRKEGEGVGVDPHQVSKFNNFVSSDL